MFKFESNYEDEIFDISVRYLKRIGNSVYEYKRGIEIKKPEINNLARFSQIGQPMPFPITPMDMTMSVPVSIPDELEREMFRHGINVIAKELRLALDTKLVENPAYNLLSLDYNAAALNGMQVKDMAENLINAIVLSTEVLMNVEHLEEDEKEVAEDEELSLDADVVEFEDDDEELAEAIKGNDDNFVPIEDDVYSLEGEKDDD